MHGYNKIDLPRVSSMYGLSILAIACMLAITFACVSSSVQKPEETLPPYESISYQVALGNPQKALEEYDIAFKKGNETEEIKILHARLLLIADKLEEAAMEINGVLGTSPKNIDALFTLAFYYRLKNNKKDQTTILEKITSIDKKYAPAYAYLGELALEDNKLDVAKSNFTQALASDPGNFVALTGLGNALMRSTEYAKAIETFTKAIDIDPKYSYNYNDRAKAKSLIKDWDGAVSDLTLAIGIAPDDYYSFIDRGKLFLDKGKKTEAKKDFTRAAEIDPDFFLAYVFLGDISYEDYNYEDARIAYENAATRKPQYYFVYEPLGAIYYMEEKWLEAEKAFSTAYTYVRDDHTYVLLAALCFKKAGMEKDAQAYITSQMSNIPQDSWYFDVARFYYNPANDVYALRRTENEKSPIEKKRILFYIAVQYLASGKPKDTAVTYLLEAENLERKDLVECKLASWELEKLQKETH